jgi:hypothetical protein
MKMSKPKSALKARNPLANGNHETKGDEGNHANGIHSPSPSLESNRTRKSKTPSPSQRKATQSPKSPSPKSPFGSAEKNKMMGRKSASPLSRVTQNYPQFEEHLVPHVVLDSSGDGPVEDGDSILRMDAQLYFFDESASSWTYLYDGQVIIYSMSVFSTDSQGDRETKYRFDIIDRETRQVSHLLRIWI